MEHIVSKLGEQHVEKSLIKICFPNLMIEATILEENMDVVEKYKWETKKIAYDPRMDQGKHPCQHLGVRMPTYSGYGKKRLQS